MPDKLHPLCLSNPRELYHLLFRAAWETMQAFAADPKFLGAQAGMIAVLHTWGQNLALHPHVHCIVPGGGLTPEGNWRAAKGKDNFLFPASAMKRVYRAKFVSGLRQLEKQGKLQFHGQAQAWAGKKVFAHNRTTQPSSPSRHPGTRRLTLKCSAHFYFFNYVLIKIWFFTFFDSSIFFSKSVLILCSNSRE